MLGAWSGAGAGPGAFPTRPPAEARKGPFALPSPPGPHGGRSCGPRTLREPSSGEEAAPVTAMAAESALQVVEKLQARLAANPDPKKVSSGRVGGAGGRWARRGPCNGRGLGEMGFSSDPKPGPTERRGAARSSPPAGAPRLSAEDSRGGRPFRRYPGFGQSRQLFAGPSRATLSAGWGSCDCAARRLQDPCSFPCPLTRKRGTPWVFELCAWNSGSW